MTSEQLYYVSGIARLIERMTLSIVIILVSIILMISFWKSLQKIDFSIKNEKHTISTTVVLVTPIFVLLILVLFSFASFSHPMVVTVNSRESEKESHASGGTYSFFGGGTKISVTEVIDIIHKSDEILSNNEANSNEIMVASSLLKTAKKDLAMEVYGEDMISECQSAKVDTSSELGCKKIMEWFK